MSTRQPPTLFGLLCGLLLAAWCAPGVILVGLLRPHKADAIALALRDLVKAVAEPTPNPAPEGAAG